MTITYPQDQSIRNEGPTDAPREEPFVPVYARTRSATGRKGGVKSWMILAPVGVLVLGAAAVVLVTAQGEDVAPVPLAEPAATGPVLPTQPLANGMAPIETRGGAPNRLQSAVRPRLRPRLRRRVKRLRS